MLVLRLFILLSFFTFSAHAGNFFPEVHDELEANQLWARPYFKPKTDLMVSDFRVWFKHPPERVFKTLTDTREFPKMNTYNVAKTLNKTLYKKIVDAKPSDAEKVQNLLGQNQLASDHNRQRGQNWTDYVFYEFNFPWPIKDRWAVQKIKVDESNAHKGEYKYSYTMEIGNMKVLKGQWELVPVEGHPGWTEFRGHYEIDTGIPVPKFIIKKAAKAGFKKDMAHYRKQLGSE